MRKYIKPSMEVISAETQRMMATSPIPVDSINPAINMHSEDGDGLVKGGVWDDTGSFWDN